MMMMRFCKLGPRLRHCRRGRRVVADPCPVSASTQDVGVAKLVAAERIRQFSRHTPSAIHNLSVQHSNSWGDVTPQSLQSRYDRHFVGITRHRPNALS